MVAVTVVRTSGPMAVGFGWLMGHGDLDGCLGSGVGCGVAIWVALVSRGMGSGYGGRLQGNGLRVVPGEWAQGISRACGSGQYEKWLCLSGALLPFGVTTQPYDGQVGAG